MSFEKLKSLVGDNEEAKELIKSLDSIAKSNIETINKLEGQVNEISSTRDKFKQGNNLVKDMLGLKQINQDTLSDYINSSKNAKVDDKSLDEITNLKNVIESLNNDKSSLTNDYESKLDSMALTNEIRDLGIGALASTSMAERMILSSLKENAVREDGKIVYKQDGKTMYGENSTLITPASKLESMKSNAEFAPFFKSGVKTGSGSQGNKSVGGRDITNLSPTEMMKQGRN